MIRSRRLIPRASVISAAALFTFSSAGALAAGAGETLYVQSPALFDQDVAIDPTIRNECAIEGQLSRLVGERLKAKFNVVLTESVDSVGSAKTLTLTILKVIGASGSVWTGKKGIVLQGTLRANGEVIGGFHAQRRSAGGALGLFRGACDILDRSAIALGKDIAEWIERPKLNAWLGEMED